MPPPREPLVRPATRAILALAALLLASPMARAGCIHPAGARDPGPGDPTHFDRLSRAGALGQAVPAGLPEGPRRCSGSLCSREHPVPLAPAPDPLRISSRDALTSAAPTIAERGRGLLPAAGDTLRPALLAPSIFHPPRPTP